MRPLRIAGGRLAVRYADQSDGEESVSTNDGSNGRDVASNDRL